jgi:hypothetical protein
VIVGTDEFVVQVAHFTGSTKKDLIDRTGRTPLLGPGDVTPGLAARGHATALNANCASSVTLRAPLQSVNATVHPFTLNSASSQRSY